MTLAMWFQGWTGAEAGSQLKRDSVFFHMVCQGGGGRWNSPRGFWEYCLFFQRLGESGATSVLRGEPSRSLGGRRGQDPPSLPQPSDTFGKGQVQRSG